MDRRTYIGVFATGGVCAAGLGLAYQLEQGNISLGDDADISETVSGGPESFEFEAKAEDDIHITLTDTQDAPYQGAFALHDPDGNEVLHGGPRSTKTANRRHTAEQAGTYRLVVNPQETSLNVNVHIRDPSE